MTRSLLKILPVRTVDFLAEAPADWDCLMFGGEHLSPPEPIAPSVVRCALTNRTHAFAVRGRMMGTLLSFWEATSNDHCDIVLASLMRHFKSYAPDPFLIGQDSGYSDVTESAESERFYSPVLERTINATQYRGRIDGLVTKAVMVSQRSKQVA